MTGMTVIDMGQQQLKYPYIFITVCFICVLITYYRNGIYLALFLQATPDRTFSHTGNFHANPY